MELFRGRNKMDKLIKTLVKLIINDKEYRIVKSGRIRKGDLVWNYDSRTFDMPLYLEQSVCCFYMVVRRVR